jgi:hypothetical protein
VKSRARVVVALVVHLAVTRITWRDLDRRAASEVRGAKWVWRVASGANTLGSVGYWLIGRKPDRSSVLPASDPSPGTAVPPGHS